ncbi:MAG: DegT/DnrJ/EryC1/StrS family aminotransferase [Kiritimatiellae bacterium]|nr:DegT/DnrJ/EryC1/StrS family aminotransferase [Kiritimatiellia bacterium]
MNRRDFIRSGGAATVMAMGGGACASISGDAGKLAYFGGTPVMSAAQKPAGYGRLFAWPIVNDAMRKASDGVLVSGKMSGRDITIKFENEFAKWQGTKYALACLNGTTALNTAFYAVGVGPGDEVICPTVTFWASCMGVVNLGGTVVFCDIKPDDLTVDPASFEARITPRTKAVVVVHYMGCPCDMDVIMPIARKHGIKVIEDVSHAQGGLYKGRKLGTIGDIGAMSLMSGKSFAIGEAGMLVTDSREYYEKSICWGMYGRMPSILPKSTLARVREVPFGGIKNRLNQCTAAVGLEQLKKYDAECAEIERAMRYWWDGLSDVDFLKIIYPKYPDSNKAGWYASRGRFLPERAPGVDNRVLVAALNAELGGLGVFNAGANYPLHWSSVFDDEDIFGNGQPPSRRFLPAGVTSRKLSGELPVAEVISARVIGDPWFKHCDRQIIDLYIEAVHKVAKNIDKLRGVEPKNPAYAFWAPPEKA